MIRVIEAYTQKLSRNILYFFTLILSIKIIAGTLFSSDYINRLFLPFVQYFSSSWNNPWQHFWQHPVGVEFPYNPLMLYILTFFYIPASVFGIQSKMLQLLFLKLPTIISDLTITLILLKIFPDKKNKILVFYFTSPIILYAAYMHSQLDLIPTAILFLAIYFLRKQHIYTASLTIGLAMSTKLHVLAALPIMSIYIVKNFGIRKALLCTTIPCLVYAASVAPYLFTDGFYQMVLTHPKQMLLFDVFATMGNFKVYLPIMALLILYGRLLAYKKINVDLMDAFLGITFASLVFLIIPSPAWYIWIIPFLSILFIKYYSQNNYIFWLYLGLNFIYIVFFIFFYTSELQDLIFLNFQVNLKITNPKLANIVFTCLEATLVLIVYMLYKLGIRSNAIYKSKQSLAIGISGDSGSGKTTFMLDLEKIVGRKTVVLEGDGDHRWERGDAHWKEFTHLDPKANYLHRQADGILALKNGHPIKRSDYNHSTGKFDPARLIKPKELVVLSGLHTFYLPKMRSILDFKIYLDPDPKIKTHWKIVRDMKDRGHSKEAVIKQLKMRESDSKRHICPQKKFADLILNYFASKNFEIGNPLNFPKLHLKITLDSSVRLDNLMQLMLENNITFTWDYSNDLESQYLLLPNSQIITTNRLEKIARKTILNSDEILSISPKWETGYRGFTQLISTLIISEKMRSL
jgi:uridine kinase